MNSIVDANKLWTGEDESLTELWAILLPSSDMEVPLN